MDFQNVKDQVDIKEFIEQEINTQAKKVGTDTWRVNPCPFCNHNDCFTIHSDTQSVHCYSCGFSGDVFIFVRKYHNLPSNYEALIYVAQKIGYQITNQKVAKQSAKLLDIKQLAVDYYHDNLINKCGDEPIKYLWDGQEAETTVLRYQTEIRGHSIEVLEKEKVGYADGGLLAYVMKQGTGTYDTLDLVKVGLANVQGYDYFPKGVYVYPHFVSGQISHFSQKDPMKVVEFQSKKEHRHPEWRFYGQSAINADDLVVVEGENDRLSVIDKAGYPYCIATIGQLSEAQIECLKQRRNGKRTYFGFDNDESGRQYTDKILDKLVGYDIAVITFDGAKDIDEYLRNAEDPKTTFQELRDKALDQYSYKLSQIPDDANLFDVLDLIKPILKKLLDYKGKAHTEAFIKTKIKAHFNLTHNELSTITKLIKELENNKEPAEDEAKIEVVELDEPIEADFHLAQEFHKGTLFYTVYLPVKIGNKQTFFPHLIGSNRIKFPITAQTLTENGIYLSKMELPSNTKRWSVDIKTPFNVFAFLAGESYSSENMFADLSKVFGRYIWHPDESMREIMALTTMETYVFMEFDQVGYPTTAGTKRVGKTKLLEILEQLAFNAMMGADFSDAYTFRKLELDQATLLVDEADELASTKQGDAAKSNAIKLFRAGYKRSGKVGRCDEENRPTEFYVYGVKILASVATFEDALGDRIIWLNPERKPPNVEVERLISRKTKQEFQILRNKLYTWALSNATAVYDAYVNLEIPTEYYADIHDRDEEIWAGLLAIAKTVNNDVFQRVLEYAKANRQRKMTEELGGAEFNDAKFLDMLLEFLDNPKTPKDSESLDFYPLFLIENACKDYFGWKTITSKTIPAALKRLHIIDDKDPKKDRIRKNAWIDVEIKEGGETKIKPVEKKVTWYRLDKKKIEEVAWKYDVINYNPTEEVPF